MSEQLHLYANCQLVDGYSRSLIYDLQRGKARPIPKSLARIVRRYQAQSLGRILNEHPHQTPRLKEQLRSLEKEGFIAFLQEYECQYFPEIEFDHDSPRELETLVIDRYPIDVEQLLPFSELGLHSLVWILSEAPEKEDLFRFLASLRSTSIDSLVLCFTEPVTLDEELLDMIDTRPRIIACWVFQSEEQSRYGEKVEFIPQRFRWNSGPHLMEPSIELYSEALFHHSYFNKKLFLTQNGYLEASYSSNEKLLRIDEIDNADPLRRLLQKEPFQKLWKVRKEETLVCKDCEFRRLCIDTRIPHYQPETEHWAHETPCGYNPYINKWEGEPGYHPVEEFDAHRSPELSPTGKERVEKLNQELWGG